MSEFKSPQYASIARTPIERGLLVDKLVQDAQKSKAIGNILVDQCDMSQPVLTIIEDGVAFVEMNTAGRLELRDGQNGLIGTGSLSGCTGLAGFAKHEDGRSFQFAGHFSPAAERLIINREYWEPLKAIGNGKSILQKDPRFTVPTPYNMGEFYDWVSKEGVKRVDMLIAYGGKNHPYEFFDVRHYFTFHNETISASARAGMPDKRTLLLPYNGDSSTLAAGVMGGQEGIFWNGALLDFDKYLEITSDPYREQQPLV